MENLTKVNAKETSVKNFNFKKLKNEKNYFQLAKKLCENLENVNDLSLNYSLSIEDKQIKNGLLNKNMNFNFKRFRTIINALTAYNKGKFVKDKVCTINFKNDVENINFDINFKAGKLTLSVNKILQLSVFKALDGVYFDDNDTDLIKLFFKELTNYIFENRTAYDALTLLMYLNNLSNDDLLAFSHHIELDKDVENNIIGIKAVK